MCVAHSYRIKICRYFVNVNNHDNHFIVQLQFFFKNYVSAITSTRHHLECIRSRPRVIKPETKIMLSGNEVGNFVRHLTKKELQPHIRYLYCHEKIYNTKNC